MTALLRTALVFCLAVSLPGVGALAAEPMLVSGVWMRPSIGSTGSSALYLSLLNSGPAEDALVSVTTDVAMHCQLHSTQSDAGVVGMRALGALPLPPGKTVALEPKGNHVMLMGLTRLLRAGDHAAVVLRFEDHAPMTVDAVVSMTPPQ